MKGMVTRHRARQWGRWALYVALVVGVLYAALVLVGSDDITAQVEAAGVWGPALLILAKIATLVFAPLGGSPLYLIAGILFGPVYGFVYIFIGDMVGAALCFYISRIFGRPIVGRLVLRHGMRMIDRVLAYLETRRGLIEARILFFAFPEVLGYALGLTNIAFTRFFLPHIVIYSAPIAGVVWIGASLRTADAPAVAFWIGVVSLFAVFGMVWFAVRADVVASDDTMEL